MASKRRPLSFPELEARGRGSILRTADEVHAEEQMLANQHTGMPASQEPGNTENQETSIPVSQTSGNRSTFPKVTYRLSPDTLEAIDEMKRLLRRRYKIKASLEEIADEAIQRAYAEMLENQQSSILVNKLASKQANKNYGTSTYR